MTIPRLTQTALQTHFQYQNLVCHHPITPSPHHPISPSPHLPISPSPHLPTLIGGTFCGVCADRVSQ